jgi:hypothetical protein
MPASWTQGEAVGLLRLIRGLQPDLDSMLCWKGGRFKFACKLELLKVVLKTDDCNR